MVGSLPVRSLQWKVRSLHQISYFAPNISYFAPCKKKLRYKVDRRQKDEKEFCATKISHQQQKMAHWTVIVFE